jgi:hypothetical protein
MGTGLPFVSVRLFTSNDKKFNDHMMCSHVSILYPDSFLLDQMTTLALNQQECLSSMIDEFGVQF